MKKFSHILNLDEQGASLEGGKTMEKFVIGVALGALCGAVLVANNYKMRALVKKSQEELSEKLDQMLDGKLEEMDKQVQTLKEEAKDSLDTVSEKIKDKKSSKK